MDMDVSVHHADGPTALTWTNTMDMDMQHRHGHTKWTWICTMGMDMHHGHGDEQAPWMPQCFNADKKFSPASLVFLNLQHLGRHRHSSIVVSPVSLVTD
jgi:hypothetical protein